MSDRIVPVLDSLLKYDCVFLTPEKDGVCILDQTLLPAEEKFLVLRDEHQVWAAIRKLKVRGAPAIGVSAAYGLYVAFRNLVLSASASGSECGAKFADAAAEVEFYRISEYLRSSRPTAVNLFHALDRMDRRYGQSRDLPLGRCLEALLEEAEAIKAEDMDCCRAIGEHGMELIVREGMGILTHCNAGHLAVSRYGTALAPIYFAHSKGLKPRVYADETRPLLQGARITVFELMKAGVDVTLLCDNMAASLMAAGKVDMVMVGCDRVAANGDVANKIGTSAVAILAHHFGIPFYVLGPTSTIDPKCPEGHSIPIEMRDGEEVVSLMSGRRIAPEGVKVYNPAFDVTPAELISGIVTEKGIFRPPYDFSEMGGFGHD